MTDQNAHSVLLAVIILTKNEEANLARCLASLSQLQADVLVVDSGSTDRTVEIAREFGARVVQHPWKNYAVQFNWAIDHLDTNAPWVARIDADEHMLPELVQELLSLLPGLPEGCSGLLVKRRVFFLGRWMKHGGYYPTWLLRFWRRGMARCEDRWMDEHMKLSTGEATRLENDIVDCNMKGLTFWIDKHNQYATSELLDLNAMRSDSGSHQQLDGQAALKRWAKESLYSKSPLFMRAFAYWFLRYFLRCGFLDGKEGLVFHFLQGFWYRFLVDAKIMEAKILRRCAADTLTSDRD